MNLKELDSAVSTAGGLFKNLEPILNRAEKWNQGQRVAAAIVSLAIAVLLLSGTLPPAALTAFALVIVAISLLTIKSKVLEAEMFVLNDKAGNHRAVLSSHEENITLHFFGARGDGRLSLGLTPKDEPYLTFFDPSFQPRAALMIPAEPGGPTLNLFGNDGKSYLQCRVSEDHASTVCLGQPEHAHLMVVADDTRQGITITDEQNKLRAALHVDLKTAVVRLDGTIAAESSAELGVYDEALPALLYRSKSGDPLIVLGADKGGSGKLDLYDSHGRLLQHMPELQLQP